MLKGAGGVPISWSIRRFATLDSTNAEIKRVVAAANPFQAPEGAVVVAEVQEGGYGRQGRIWKSPLGGLYCSLLLRPGDHGVNPMELPTLSLVVAAAVCRALEQLGTQENIQIKWPNDVVCSAGKLCGISLEAFSGAVCIGIGINIFEPFEEVTLAGTYDAAYAVLVTRSDGLPHKVDSEGLVSKQEEFKEEILRVLLGTVGRCYGIWIEQGFTAFQQEFQRRSSLQGSMVRLATQSDGTIVQGEVVGVDAQGRLLLKTQAGESIAAESGEAHIL